MKLNEALETWFKRAGIDFENRSFLNGFFWQKNPDFKVWNYIKSNEVFITLCKNKRISDYFEI